MIAYWNPTSGNDSNDGLSVANAKLTIGAAETVAGLGGTVVLVNGTHSIGTQSFAGGRTYQGETNGLATIALTTNGTFSITGVSSDTTTLKNIKVTYNNVSSAHILNFFGTGRIDILSNTFTGDVSNVSGWNFAGQTFNGTLTFRHNTVSGLIERASSSANLFTTGSIAGDSIISNNSFYIETGTSSGLNVLNASAAGVIFKDNLLQVDNSISLTFGGGTKVRSGNVYYGDDASLSLVSDEQRINPSFIDPSNSNLTLLPNSPAITSGGVSGLPDLSSYANVYYIDDTNSGGNGSQGNPWNWTNDWATVISTMADGDILVFDETDSYSSVGNRQMGILTSGMVTYASAKPLQLPCTQVNSTTAFLTMYNIGFTGGRLFSNSGVTTMTTYGGIFTSTGTNMFSATVDWTALGTVLKGDTGISSIGEWHFTGCTFYSNAISNNNGNSTFAKCLIMLTSSGSVTGGMTTSNASSSYFYNVTNSGGTDLSGDPLFIDPSNANLNLLPNSPAITGGGVSITGDYYLDFSATPSGANDGTIGNPWARFEEVGNNQTMKDEDVVLVTRSSHGQTNTGTGLLYHGHNIIYRSADGDPVVINRGSVILALAATGVAGRRITFDGVSINGSGTVGRILDFQNNGTQRECKLVLKNAPWTVKINGSVEWLCSMSTSFQANNEFTIENCSVRFTGSNAGSGSSVVSSCLNIFARNVNVYSEQTTGAQVYFSGLMNSGSYLRDINILVNLTAGYSGSRPTLNTNSPLATVDNIVWAGLNAAPLGGTNLTNADPLFIDAANGNFNLLPNSPAITAGA